MKANDTKSETKGKRADTGSVKKVAEPVEVNLKMNSETKKETKAAPVNETPKADIKEKKATEAVPVKKKQTKASSVKGKEVTASVKVEPKASPAPAKAEPKASPAPAKAEPKPSAAPAKADAKTSVAVVAQKAEKMNAVKTDEASYLFAAENIAYNFGAGDFTVEAWVKTNQAGTIIARKGDAPGPNNGGFLLVVKEDGSIKLATDDGTGFYEVISNQEAVLDDRWHHVLGVRQAGKLNIYLDFVKLDKAVQTNHFTPLNVNSSNNLTIAFTEQQGEVHQHLEGQLADVRVWNIAKIYESKEKYNALKLKSNEKGLVGWWNFSKKDGSDFSGTKNRLETFGNIEFVEKK